MPTANVPSFRFARGTYSISQKLGSFLSAEAAAVALLNIGAD